MATARQLPGWDQTEGDAAWLSERPGRLVLRPGASASFTIRLDARAVTRPGLFTGSVLPRTDTAYWTAPVAVSFRVAGRVGG
ncbi:MULTISPECIES: hypothetical protein [Streptomyces]|uniref:hypothetical protein n=1 Tax=Streptomyces TaxID=1883 RepID=UPI0023DCED10|nr:hypothetical protein [Streptomyces sp. FXJ1.172]WEP00926.1 hypothetical protein A6P39_042980 [Streptomyces sp. FXJ1.172]